MAAELDLMILKDDSLFRSFLQVEMEYEIGGRSHNTAILTFLDVETAEAAICK